MNYNREINWVKYDCRNQRLINNSVGVDHFQMWLKCISCLITIL